MPSALQHRGRSELAASPDARFTLVRPFFSWRRTCRVFNAFGGLVMVVHQPWFQIRTELVLYGDEELTQPILTIKNRRLAAVDMEHDLFDAASGVRLGVVRSRGLRSLLQDTWDILDADERLAGQMIEDGAWYWRRLLRFLPGRHRIELGGQEVARIEQRFRLFQREFELELLPAQDPIEPRLAIACAILAMQADLRRESSD
ncbi:MAG: hypothetical protein NVS4B10_20050 [Myxococcales bacterium]